MRTGQERKGKGWQRTSESMPLSFENRGGDVASVSRSKTHQHISISLASPPPQSLSRSLTSVASCPCLQKEYLEVWIDQDFVRQTLIPQQPPEPTVRKTVVPTPPPSPS